VEDYEQLAGPLILLPLMFVVGLQLTPEDFRRVLTTPRAVVGGTLGQLLLLPLMTWALVAALPVSPDLAVGAVLLSATPGAGMSNVMAAVSRANVALSVTLTAVASILSVATLPLLATLGISLFVGDSLAVEVPVGTIVFQLIAFLAIPIVLGMIVRRSRPQAAQRYVSRANRFAVIAILFLTALGALGSDAALPARSEFGMATLAALAWTLAAMAIGFAVGRVLGLAPRDRFTLVIEFAARNLALTIIVAIASLGRLEFGLFAAAYSMTGFPLVIVLAVLRGRRAPAEPS
jgi:BASS family bile acid:Na+ symporter